MRLWHVVAGCAALALAAPAHAERPVLDRDFADPFVLPDGERLVAYATNTGLGRRHVNVQVSVSPDAAQWSAPAEAMPTLPPWADTKHPDVWAPEAIRIGDTFVLYFSARHRTLKRPDGLTLCVGAAVAARAEGPFTPQSEPLTCGGAFGAIDASPMRDGADLWLYVKTDGNCCGAPISFIAQRLAPDGLALTGAPTVLGGITNDARWEGRVIEGPEMRRHDGELTLFFAGGDYTRADYAFGYARCATPAGPCRDSPENPILAGGAGLNGPGHGSVFDWRGRSWLAIAAWRLGFEPYRAMYVRPLDWVGGRPVIAPAR